MWKTCNHDSGSLFFHILMRPIIAQVSGALLELPHITGVLMDRKWHLRGEIARSSPSRPLPWKGDSVFQGGKGLPAYKASFVTSALSSGALATTGSGWETLLSLGLQTFRTAALHPHPGFAALSYWATSLPAIYRRPPLIFDLCNEEENSSPANSAQEFCRN